MAGMTTLLTVASALSGLNIVLLLALATVWGRNYREFRSSLTLGLVGFAVVLLVENIIALSFFFTMGMLYAGSSTAQLAVVAMRALQFLALVFITATTMR